MDGSAEIKVLIDNTLNLRVHFDRQHLLSGIALLHGSFCVITGRVVVPVLSPNPLNVACKLRNIDVVTAWDSLAFLL